MFEERDEIELIRTLFQNRTTGVVSDIIRVCQMMLKSKSIAYWVKSSTN